MVKYGEQSIEADSFHNIMQNVDSINLVKVRFILDNFGWLGPEDYGNKGATTLFLVVQHSDLATMQYYLPMLQQSVLEGKAMTEYLATLYDRILILQDKPQMFGTQYKIVDNLPSLYPIQNVIEVNNLRRMMGMEELKL